MSKSDLVFLVLSWIAAAEDGPASPIRWQKDVCLDPARKPSQSVAL